MAVKTQPGQLSDFLLAEAPNLFSRRAVKILSGTPKVGTVLTLLNNLLTGAAGTNTGNGTLTAISAGPKIEPGVYTVTITATAANGGSFSVTNPRGGIIGTGVVATPFVSNTVNFTVNDGSTDFALNDSFTITVAGYGQAVPVSLAGVATQAYSGTGNGVMTLDATNPVRKNAKPGAYTVRVVTAAANGGTFRVEDPDGFVLGDVAVGATFDDDIRFSIADGSTDFIVGDTFTVTVSAPALRADAILGEDVDASVTAQDAFAINRHAIVGMNALIWPALMTKAQIADAIADMESRLQILVRQQA